MLQPRPALRIVPAFVLTLSLVGCGLFGSNDNPLNGTLTYKVEGPSEAEVFISKSYFYVDEGCKVARSGTKTLPIEETLKPEETSGQDNTACPNVDLSNFDGVQVSVTLPPREGASTSLTVRLLSDGNVVDEATTPTNGRTWTVELGSVPR